MPLFFYTSMKKYIGVTDKKLLFQHERRVTREKGNYQYESTDLRLNLDYEGVSLITDFHTYIIPLNYETAHVRKMSFRLFSHGIAVF